MLAHHNDTSATHWCFKAKEIKDLGLYPLSYDLEVYKTFVYGTEENEDAHSSTKYDIRMKPYKPLMVDDNLK